MASLQGIKNSSSEFGRRCQKVTEKALQTGYLYELFPNAVKQGRELLSGDIYGSSGKSFRVNVNNCKWADFAATGQKGRDLVSLLALREDVSRAEALEKLEEHFNLAPLPKKARKTLPEAPTMGAPTKTWIYSDQYGNELYRAQRWEQEGYSKACRLSKANDVTEKVPLYLPEILRAIKQEQLIFVVEGEPKADVLRAWGLAATAFANGANGYQSEMSKWFTDAGVIILPDADDPGREFAQKIATDIAALPNKGIKVIDLPGAKFEGYDIVDWQKDGGDLKQLAALVKNSPFFNPPMETGRAFQFDIKSFAGFDYMGGDFKEYDWLIKDSFRRGQLGLLCGPPGCGKGIFSIQLTLALAAGQDLFDGHWPIDVPAKVMFISAEDDREVLHHRIYYASQHLGEEERKKAGNNFWAIPVHGRVSLCENTRNDGIKPTINLDDLRNLVDSVRPDLIILDTLARFFEVDENDNPAVTAACGLLEDIIQEYGCNIILVHHASKASGDLATDKNKLRAALNQTAIRGASALSGCIRWALLMAPLSDTLAEKIIGSGAYGKPSGSYVAARVAKKNAGRSEKICYLERGDHGILVPVRPLDEEDQKHTLLDEARLLAEEVERREQASEEPLTEIKGPRDVFGWNSVRAKRAVSAAIEDGLIVKVKSQKNRGYVLVSANKNESPFCDDDLSGENT